MQTYVYYYNYDVTLTSGSILQINAANLYVLKEMLKLCTKEKISKVFINYACIANKENGSFTYELYNEEAFNEKI